MGCKGILRHGFALFAAPIAMRTSVHPTRHAGPDPDGLSPQAFGPQPPRVRTVLWRGVRRRCPHCGRGPLFVRWITFHERCAVCGLVLLRNQGDTWLFWIVMDRIPILAGIAAIYFGFRITGWLSGLLFFLAIAGPLVLTMPQRQGVALALSYLSRVWFPDPSDEMPPIPK